MTTQISKHLTLLLGLAVSAAIFCGSLPIAAAVSAIPGIPHQFYGSVNLTSGASPEGLLIVAKVGNLIVASGTVQGGKYGYNPLFKAEDVNNNLGGKTVEFYVNGIKANETAIFANGNSSQLNLTIPVSIPTTPIPPPASTGSTSGGGSYTPPVSNPLSAAAQKVDANKDGRIDVLDFNSLMVNWGKTGTGNIADFNADGKVDVFDFNLLMINWTL